MAAHLITLAFCLMLICGLVRSDGVTSRDILNRIEELESRDQNLQAEVRIQSQRNEALEKEVKRLQERDVEQTNRIALLEEREQEMLLQTKQNEANIIELKRFKGSEIDITDRVRVLEEKEHTMEKAIGELLRRTEDTTGPNTKNQAENDDNSNAKMADDHKPETKVGVNETIQHEAVLPTNSHSRIRQADPEMTIAFFASITNHTYHMGHFQPIVFDNVITNVGHAYHPTSGYFFAPVSGVYVFAVTILTNMQMADFEFALNGKLISRMYNSPDDSYETTSQTAILSLSKGDEVILRNVNTDVALHGEHYCTFSGFLLTTNLVLLIHRSLVRYSIKL